MTEEGNSWDIVSENDLWKDEDIESDGECFILVRHEDVAEEMASLMVSYILSLDHRKVYVYPQVRRLYTCLSCIASYLKPESLWFFFIAHLLYANDDCS